MIEADVEAAEDEQERRDGLAHPVVDRRAPAVNVAPPGLEVGRPFAGDLLVIDLAQVNLHGLGHEFGHRRPRPPQLVIVVLGGRG